MRVLRSAQERDGRCGFGICVALEKEVHRAVASGGLRSRWMEGLEEQVDRVLAPWGGQLGRDRDAYANHVLRVLDLCDLLHHRSGADEESPPTSRVEFLVAGACHDLGIWTAGTFDYLGPSVALARDVLDRRGRPDLESVVAAMIEQHHKLRSAGPPGSPVELFRRADTVDVTFGGRRFGLPHREYRAVLSRYPDRGFHPLLVALAAKRLRTHPFSPLPMLKW